MTTTTDTSQRTGAAQGDLWSEHATDWSELQELHMRPLYEAGLDAMSVATETRHLDAGCGAGMALAMAAERGAYVSGFDAAPAFIAIARGRVPRAQIAQGDLQELPFPDQAFDTVAGFNSFQYAADPGAALGEARRVLRPGGLLVAATWAPAEMCDLADHLAAVGRLLPPPRPGAPGPFALSGDGALASLLSSAGLEPQHTEDVICRFDYPDDDIALRALMASGPCVRAARHAGEAPTRDAVLESIAKFRQSDGSYRIANPFRFTLAARASGC